MFDPTLPPPGRLARLGVVLDAELPPEQVAALARLCERAGIDAVWVASRLGSRVADGILGSGPARPDPWAAARVAASELERARLGVVSLVGSSPLAGIAVEVCVSDEEGAAQLFTRMPGTRRSILVERTEQLPSVLPLVDDVVLTSWTIGDLETAADEARAVAAEQGRDPASLGVAAILPVSIGRTGAEATARANMDPGFGNLGPAADIGIFGALEECQDRVIALAHAGVTDLRCIVPMTPDVHDVIAQLTAMTIGTTDVLVPGSLRSPAPPPPSGWGGRAERPPRPGVSGGSRRR